MRTFWRTKVNYQNFVLILATSWNAWNTWWSILCILGFSRRCCNQPLVRVLNDFRSPQLNRLSRMYTITSEPMRMKSITIMIPVNNPGSPDSAFGSLNTTKKVYIKSITLMRNSMKIFFITCNASNWTCLHW